MTENATDQAPPLDEYLRHVLRAPVHEVARETPVEVMRRLSTRLHNTVLVKREDQQPVHSFKLRGAYTAMSALPESDRSRGVVTASAGNHAQGVAVAAAKLGIDATVVMPTITPAIKVDAVRALGARVVLEGSSFDDAAAHAKKLAEAGAVYVPPFDDPLVIAGQGTIGLELLRQHSDLDAVFVPVGGGGLASGVAVVLKQLVPSVAVYGVEPEDAACLTAALAAGYPVELDSVGTFAEGTAVKRVGEYTFELCRSLLDGVITVSSDEISAAVKDVFEDTRAVAEPAGAVALAGLKKHVDMQGVSGQRLVHVLSGSNLNFHALRYISERAEIGEQREALFGVGIPEQQGAFLEFCRLLRGRTVTEFNYRTDGRDLARVLVGVHLQHGRDERVEISEELAAAGYSVVDLSEDDAAKSHVRYMVGQGPGVGADERFYSFEFPERPGALMRFLTVLGSRWNITAFHYRSHGTDYGRVLCAFEHRGGDDDAIVTHLRELGYRHRSVDDSPGVQFFMQ